MNKYYKIIMNGKSSLFARVIDGVFAVFSASLFCFFFALTKFKSMTAARIITLCAAIIAVAVIFKIKDAAFKRFKKKIDREIRSKLILEQIVFNREPPKIKGYESAKDDILISDDGKKARLIRAYPKTILTPADIIDCVSTDIDEIIATCDFDDDCVLLCERKGVALKNKDFLLKNILTDIDESMIEQEIAEEVKHISEIKQKRKSSVFKSDRRNKYLLASLFLLVLSGFMGAYRIIYIAFSGMCMSFFFISSLISKPQ